ncbi:MAG: kinase [Pseudonocardiaceae bacterium]
MRNQGVILYGPPASGKDTVTRALTRMDSVFSHFLRFKVGDGRATGYELISADEASTLRRRGDILYENTRYGNLYLVDRPRLISMFENGFIPIIHLGQVAGVRAIGSYPANWLSVLLWCPRKIAEERMAARGSTDVDSRLTAWDETWRDIEQSSTGDFDLRVDTHVQCPDSVAHLVRSYLRSSGGS